MRKILKKIVKICHENNVNVLLALNTIIYQNEIKKVESLVKKAKKYGVDAIICWDFSVIELCKKYNLKTHISTQASISNYESIYTIKKNYPNIERIVLARECTLEQIKKIINLINKNNLGVQIEVFIHGSMCVSISGRCFLSQEIFGKSANRGECLQPCRRKYDVYLKDPEEGYELLLGNDYVMSPKDLCGLPIIEKIIDSGVHALKIEGRNKSPEYVYTVVNVYRRAIDEYTSNNHNSIENSKKELIDELKKVYNRGFSTGFYLGKPINEWNKEYGSSSTETKAYVGKVLNYYNKISVAEILIESNTLNEGDEILIIGETTGLVKQKSENMMINNQKILNVEKGKIITLKVREKVRKNDQLYKIIKRDTNTNNK
ncbi:MAG: collagenase [Candidatus Woesearchaeota archaeon]|nr:MAG: collagenase [Candidatus Woesearchaeota archaeon]